MKEFIQYILGEVKGRRLLKTDAIDLMRQFQTQITSTKPLFLNPLLHQNTSDLSEQRFSSTFTGKEFFFSDHVVKGQRVLPGVAYLEMARAAVDLAAGTLEEGQTGIRLKDIAWARPIVVGDQSGQVHIGLYPGDNGEITYEIYCDPETVDAEPVINSQGIAVLSVASEVPTMDLKALQTECSQRTLSSTECYEVFKGMGIEYGPGHQGIEKVYVGSGQVLAKLSLPSCVSDTLDQFVLHPSLMDSAFQASVGLITVTSETGRNAPVKPFLPFALQELEVLGKCTSSMWVLIRYSEGSKAGDKVQKLDIDLCDVQGTICVRMKGFSSRVLEGEIQTSNVSNVVFCENASEPLVGTNTLAPVWDVVPVEKGQTFPSPSEQLVIVGGTKESRRAIQQHYPKMHILEIQTKDTIDEIANKLEALGFIDHILWVAPHHSLESLAENTVIEEQNQGVSQVFRMIKALLRLGYGSKDLGWSVLTTQAQPIHKKDAVNPIHASVHGLIGSMAKEYPNWKIRLIDLEVGCDWPLANIFTLPADPQGNGWVYRGLEWYRQKLVPVHHTQLDTTMYKLGGVYVVIGGAGGIGEVWSDYMIRTYQAQIIWIGRRPKDAVIQAKLDKLATIGSAPYYIAADATDQKALTRAYKEIKERYARIHGVIHSAIVLLDQSLAKMEEERFQAGLSAKVDVSVRIAQVFEKEALDFVMFFSSINSFAKAAGQSNYASGCTFKDAFAHQLSQEWPCAVKVMNWGYWGSVGIVSSKAYRDRMVQAGIDSIEPQEAMEALEVLLTGVENQIALMKTTRPLVVEGINSEELIIAYPETLPSSIQNIQDYMQTITKPKSAHGASFSTTGVNTARLLNKVQAVVIQSVSKLLNVKNEDIDVDAKLNEYGFDPIMLTKFISKLNKEFNIELNTSIFFEHSTLLNFTQYLVDEYKDQFVKQFAQEISSVVIQDIDVRKGESKIHYMKSEVSIKMKGMEDLLCRLLLGQLQAIGLFTEKNVVISGLKTKIGLRELYDRWFEQSINVLVGKNYLQNDGLSYSVIDTTPIDRDAVWKEWDQQKGLWLEEPNMKAQVVLVESTLRALPEVLTGKRLATDIMFPNSSMELVEGIYKNNLVVDYFNEVLADTVVAYLKERLQQEPTARIRIIEIGAGTGGTSAMVFQKLEPYQDHIQEYCYTDISKAFLMHAEKEYGRENPYLTYQLFNVEEPVAGQSIREGGYDLVIAANVLHATKNIRQTLRNTKAVLKNNGLILLNELSGNSLFTHLTFGLLEGWWLYEDSALRIPGCPGLFPETWQAVLESEGFRSIFYPAQEAHELGQQIVVAESDGVVRQKQQLKSSAPAVKQSVNTQALKEQSPKLKPLVTQTRGITKDLLREKSTSYFKKIVGETLKMPSNRIDSSEPLEKYGIDSILVVQLTNTLRKVFNDISSTIFFEYQTIDALVEHFLTMQKDSLINLIGLEKQELDEELSGDDEIPVEISAVCPKQDFRKFRRFLQCRDQEIEESQIQSTRIQDVAIIGLSGRYPRAKNVNEFWNNLKSGRNCITEIPKSRWDWKEYFDEEKGKNGSIYTKWGGFIEDIDKFDPLFFSISPAEAERIDPQERLFLEVAYASIEDAGYMPATLCDSRKIGVFVGAMNGNYPTGSNYWSIANRISYLLNFQGPSMAVDTACSSSLTAIHLALESLYSGMSECAIAGGVNLIVDPVHYLKLSSMTMLSSSDKCKSFGDQADGFVDGEGVGAIVLKPLSKAIADGDHIYGIIKGSMLNAGGKTNGYTVPNPNAQFQLITGALERARVNARTMSYLEAHGTGTALGDPIEIAGLTRAFEQDTQDKQFCTLGSVKSNIGHCESAAGIAGVTKVLMQLKYRQLVPSLHSEVRNPNINFTSTPFIVQQELAEWKRPMMEVNGETKEYPRIAGISAFGAGGANAHIVIEEYIPKGQECPPITITPQNPAIIVLSAKNEERLQELVKKLLAAIGEQQFSDRNLSDMAYTLQVGREAMEERLAMIVGSIEELEEKLKCFVEGQDSIEDLYRGQVKRNKETLTIFAADEELQEAIEKWIQRRKYSKLLELWVKGLNLDWNKLYGDIKPCRISLPTYPFARERYWFSENKTQSDGTNTATSAMETAIVFEGEIQTGNVSDGVSCETSSETLVGTIMLSYVWDQIPIEKGPTFPSLSDQVVIVGGTKDSRSAIRQHYPEAHVLEIQAKDTIDEIANKLEAHGSIDHILWIASHHSLESLAADTVIEEQNQGVIQVFRMIKALLRLGYGSRELGWSLFTIQAQPIHKKDAVNPTHASVHGLIGSMAKEYPNWKIRLIDLEAGCDWPLGDILTLPADSQGNGWVYRGLEWYRQKLVPVHHTQLDTTMYKLSGVYVVIGGAGGIGEAWSDYMIRTYRAQIVWIGRRPKDAVIQAQLDKLATIGPEPYYIVADATDQSALTRAYEEIKERYAQIHGVIHSAIVLLDQSLAKMDEGKFQAGLSAKVDVSVRIAQAFEKEALDFIMFFSSINSFAKAAGQSNYTSGCTFKDAFAHQLSEEWPCAVKVINWGYWGSVGIAASKVYRERMAQAGIGSIEPSEAMEALEILLAGSMNQIGLVKTTKPLVMEGGNQEELITVYLENIPSSVQNMQIQLSIQDSQIKQRTSEVSMQMKEMEDLLCRLLLGQLQSMGLFNENNPVISDIRTKTELRNLYDRWLEESIAVLVGKNYLEDDGLSCSVIDTTLIDRDAAWKEWDQQKGPWLEDPNMKAQVVLIEATLHALPEILTGTRLATDVMFPNSSMELVEGIYKNNLVADYFNEMLADTAAVYLKERLQQDPSARIRILEIGAGTGGTSAMVFQKLKPYQDHIQEYCYTDISKAFLMHAEKEYGPDNTYLTYQLFNVEATVAGQSIRAGGYDLVIAANVLHATKNIRQTLRNTKAVLKNNGLILLNELSGNSLFTHLTFGLLEGWWLYEDSALRIPGCPGLFPETWQAVLESEGFRSIFYPAQEAHELGQQIVVAESDGVVRQKQQLKPSDEYSHKMVPIENFKKIPQKIIDGLSRKLYEGLVDTCGIPILKVFQSLGFFTKIDQKINVGILYEKFCYSSNLNKVLNTLLDILKKLNLIEVQGNLIFLSEIGNSMETINRLQSIESRFELLIRAMPELSSHIYLVKYCIENYPAVLNGKISCEKLLESKLAFNWIRRMFISDRKAFNEYYEHYIQIISQILTKFNNKEVLTIVDLAGWMENPISQIIMDVINKNEKKSEYFYLEGSPEFKELIHKACQNETLFWNNKLQYVNVYSLKNENEILERIFPEIKVDLIIIQGDLSDTRKLENQLNFAKEIIHTNGLILVGNYPILSEFNALTFGLIQDRLLYQTEPNLFDKAPDWSSVFNKFGFQTELLFGERLVLAWHELEKDAPSFVVENRSIEVISGSDIIALLIQSFSSLLGIAQKDLDIDTNLQDYGLDSIMISRAYILLKNTYGEILSPHDMVSHNTIKQLANQIERQKKKLALIDVPYVEEPRPVSILSTNVERIELKSEEVTIYSSKKREDVTIEMPNVEELTEKTKTIDIQFDEDSIHTDLIKTSCNREYEIVTSGEGPAIIFLTGLAFTWKIWRHQIPILREQYRLIFPHFPGHGASVSKDGEFTFEDLSDDLIDILNYYQIDCTHLVGWCMGGNIAQLFALRYPEKLKSLILVGTTPTDARIRGVNKVDLTNYSANPLDAYNIEFRNCLKNSPFRNYLLELYLEYLRDSYCQVNNVYVINYINNLFHFDSIKLLKDINIPTLVISGKLDIAFPAEQVRLLHREITGSKYIEFDQSGHLPFLTQNDQFNNELLQFLTVKKRIKEDH